MSSPQEPDAGKNALPDPNMEELKAQRAYLLARACQAGELGLGQQARYRDFGRSANAMVEASIPGHGRTAEELQEVAPRDPADLAACYRAYRRAPEHLQEVMEQQLEAFRHKVGEHYKQVLEEDFWEEIPLGNPEPEQYRQAWEERVQEPNNLREETRQELRERLQQEIRYLLDRARHAGSMSMRGPTRYNEASNALVRMGFTHEQPEREQTPSNPEELRACMYTCQNVPPKRRADMVNWVEQQRKRLAAEYPEVQEETFLEQDPNRQRRGIPIREFVQKLEQQEDSQGRSR